MKRSGLVIFDIDGTLFRTETVTVPAVERTFLDLGLAPPPEEEIFSFFGRPVEEFHEWLRSLAPDAFRGEVVAAVDRTELELVSETGELYRGVREVLTTLRASVAEFAICSNGRSDYVERVIRAQDLGRYFNRVRHRRSDADTKPSMVAELLAELTARPAIVVGDRHDDIEAAHENGILAIAARYGYGSPEELAGADAAAETPSELPGLVAALMNRE
jgi:phosphoglycolate phosphatase